MLNMIMMMADWMFANAYTVMNICVVGAIICLVIGITEMAQDEVETIVEFYEERRNYNEKIASLNERA